MYRYVILGWILICCIAAKVTNVRYATETTEFDLDIISLENHQRHKRQVPSPSTPVTSTNSSGNQQTTTTRLSSPVVTERQPFTSTTQTTGRSLITSKSATERSTTLKTATTRKSTTTKTALTGGSTTLKTPTKERATTTGHSSTDLMTQPSTTSTSKLITESTGPTTNILQTDHHKYYKSTTLRVTDGHYWDELYNHTQHVKLSNNGYLSSAAVNLPFTMPFYGHNINKVQLTTGGFMYMSPYVHRFLTFSQYVAPLMANFDTKSANSEVRYKEYSDRFVVEWRNVNLNDQNHHGQFTFQTKLYKNGIIMFIYKTIPVNVSEISFDNHPVKLGLSDAYYRDYDKNGVRYRQIYKYHKIDIDFEFITDNTVITFEPLPTCNIATDCDMCISPGLEFQCSWCPDVWRCSDSIDWYRQEWQESGCSTSAGNTTDICLVTTTTPVPTTIPSTTTPTTTMSTTTPTPTTISTTESMTTQTSSTRATTSTILLPKTTHRTKLTSKSTLKKTTTLRPTTTPTTTITTTKSTTTRPSSTKATISTKQTTTPTTTTKSTTRPITTPATTSTTTARPTTAVKLTTTVKHMTTETPSLPVVVAQVQQKKDSSNTASVVVPVVLVLVVLVVLVGGWVYYAYTHPNTGSGQWLIEYRPSKLKDRISNMFKWDMQTGDKYKIENEATGITMESTA